MSEFSTWDRLLWNAAARRDAEKLDPRPKVPTPDRIHSLRTSYCDHFIKTGVLDEGIAAQLKEYADERRAAAHNPSGIPAKPAS